MVTKVCKYLNTWQLRIVGTVYGFKKQTLIDYWNLNLV